MILPFQLLKPSLQVGFRQDVSERLSSDDGNEEKRERGDGEVNPSPQF